MLGRGRLIGWFLPLLLLLPTISDSGSIGIATAAEDDAPALIRSVGINGTWKLGQNCSVTVAVPPNLANRVYSVEVTTLDGDGVEVVYRVHGSDVTDLDSVSVPIRIGHKGSLLSARLCDESGEELARSDRRLAESEGLSETQPLIVGIGSLMGLEDLSRVSANGSNSNFSSVVLQNASDLPTGWREYLACDLLVISTADVELLTQISETQWDALDQWIRRGGGCVVSLGSAVEQLRKIQPLVRLIPGDLVADSRISNPAPLESLVITDQPLQAFSATLMEANRGRIHLALNDNLSRRLPWWVSSAHGHGTVQVIASDLSDQAFAAWKDRKSLWLRLIDSYLDRDMLEDGQADSKTGAASYLGYSDLTGQLRATLDLFAQVRVITFGQVVAILLAIMLLIGPVDYYLSVRWLKRPGLSWPIAGTMLLGSCAALVWAYQELRPDVIRTNSVQVVDLDVESGRVDGHLWSHVYSAHARRVDVEATETSEMEPLYLDWQGLPGRGLGALQSQFQTDRGMPSYVVDVLGRDSTKVIGVGIPAGGTKCFYGSWSKPGKPLPASDLREMRSVDQLEGELINPLDVDLKDAMLFYHGWYYVLRSRIPPGERVAISVQTIPKDLTRRLNRQRDVDGKVASDRWDPSNRQDVDRLMELMMFHKAASGRNYTSLNHRYQPIVDQSNLLDTNYALLVGRVDQAPSQLRVSASDSKEQQPLFEAGLDRTWYRIAIPVQSPVSK